MYTFDKRGVYNVSLFSVPDSGTKMCPDSVFSSVRVVLHQASFFTDCKLSRAPALYFKNRTARFENIYAWSEMNKQDSSLKDLAFSRDLANFDLDTGEHIICLRTTDPAYCIDKSCTTVYVKTMLKMANVFTPGKNDGYNDVFKLPFLGYKNYELKIYNRWGERVFYSQDPRVYCNGKVNNTGMELPSVTYFYQLSFTEDCKEKPTFITGSVNLLRQ